jgi:hypothetical protein
MYSRFFGYLDIYGVRFLVDRLDRVVGYTFDWFCWPSENLNVHAACPFSEHALHLISNWLVHLFV